MKRHGCQEYTALPGIRRKLHAAPIACFSCGLLRWVRPTCVFSPLNVGYALPRFTAAPRTHIPELTAINEVLGPGHYDDARCTFELRSMKGTSSATRSLQGMLRLLLCHGKLEVHVRMHAMERFSCAASWQRASPPAGNLVSKGASLHFFHQTHLPEARTSVKRVLTAGCPVIFQAVLYQQPGTVCMSSLNISTAECRTCVIERCRTSSIQKPNPANRSHAGRLRLP